MSTARARRVPLVRPALLLAVLTACTDSPSSPDVSWCGTGDDLRGVRVSLGVGESLPLPEGAPICLELRPAEAEYALAFLDVTSIRAEEEGTFPFYLPDYRVSLTDWSDVAAKRLVEPAAQPAPVQRDVPADHEPHALGVPPGVREVPTAVDAHPTTRDRPWTVGEEDMLWDPVTEEVRPIAVRQVHGDYLVVAAFTDVESPTLEWTLAQLDSAGPHIVEIGLPLLESSFTTSVLPRTSPGSEQMLLLVHPELYVVRQAVGIAHAFEREGETLGVIAVTPNVPDSRRTYASLSSIVIHEMAHTLQYRYQTEHHFPPEGWSARVRWAVEGGAVLLQREYVRRLAGIGLFDNHDWRRRDGSAAEVFYAQTAQPGSGLLTRGYGPAAGFFYDQVRRRILAGEDAAAALRHISEGAVNGWALRSASLGQRQRERFGSSWEPARAILRWTLSYVGDDRTPSATHQNQTFLNIWDVREGETGWRPEASLELGQGRTVAVSRRYGSPGYVYVLDPEGTGRLRLDSSVDGTRWEILRIR